jgi:hypothetical protein
MDWIATYNDSSEYSSDDHTWESLPSEGFIKLMITLPAGGKMQMSGWDFYAVENLSNGIKLSYWKDVVANDINGDPIDEPALNKGASRCFFNDGTAEGISYVDAVDIYTGIPEASIKAGKWVTDELAVELGIL